MTVNKPKIAILTQPLGHNYGGLLQAFALQRLLESRGYQVETINRVVKPSLRLKAKIMLKHALSYVRKQAKYLTIKRSDAELNQNLIQFRDGFIKLSPSLKSSKALRDYILANEFDAVVVGSDQVWRPRYSPKLDDFFLGFISDVDRLIKISYAASFGVAEFDVSSQQKSQYAELLSMFDAVSVREASAVKICERELSYHGVQVIADPTLYFDQAFYSGMAKRGNVLNNGGYLLAYVLDKAEERTKLVNVLSKLCNLPVIELMPQQVTRLDRDGKPLRPVEDWLASFQNAEYVITDSFHGCVFSLIFRKKFIAIGNMARGLDRFASLLSTFCLNERLICDGSLTDYGSIYSRLKDEINWEEIELIREQQNAHALKFLQESFLKFRTAGELYSSNSESGDD